MDRGPETLHKSCPRLGRRIAVIGAGISGIVAASVPRARCPANRCRP